ncbi:hypothetical protein JTE90_017568 [Oedothorax gibbosus]|uniref:Methyltransferase-like protein 17, mitochondrial n=1 Tax=Oedothorax gibbosus TaxID=931172 RepID=A0AAV6UMA3_9ARAC|nr:hypothetical protein JTE90_017568 [Oedothorax gibbosus]
MRVFPLNNLLNANSRCFSKKFSFDLFPEVEELLDSGDMKHKRHPGTRKRLPILIPPTLATAVDNLISEEGEKKIKQDALKFMEALSKRRQPLEKEEIEMKLQQRFHKHSDDVDEIIESLTKDQLNALRNQIRLESARWKPFEYNRQECLAYLVGRLNANYASIWKVFNEIKSQLHTFQPETFFDFGTGVGTAVWAANNHWAESIKEYFCVDSSPDMIEVAQTLLTDEFTKQEIFKNLYFRQFLPASENRKYDLVVSAYSLLDLPSFEERLKVIDILWRKTKDILVIIEHGNFAGFFSVLDARDFILQLESDSSESDSLGAHIVAPCPHELPCPMLNEEKKKSCGTYVNYETSYPKHRTVIKKDWISYVVLRKGPIAAETHKWPRIVKPVIKKSGHVYCRCCCSNGNINEVIVTKGKHGRNAYRCARSSRIGDMMPVKIEPTTENIG